jgi:DNA-binding IclR family transcriptional regulator
VPLAHSLQIGERGPIYCSASGKAILSALPDAEAEAWVTRMPRPRITPRTRTAVAEIMQELRAARQAGYAVAREEAILGVTAIAAPVRNATGQPVGALSIAGPSARIGGAREAELGAAIREAAERMSAEFGWRPRETAPA